MAVSVCCVGFQKDKPLLQLLMNPHGHVYDMNALKKQGWIIDNKVIISQPTALPSLFGSTVQSYHQSWIICKIRCEIRCEMD